MWAAGLVFLATYVALSVPRLAVRGRTIGRPFIAAAGALLMLLVGGVSVGAARSAIDVPTLVLLLGMMLLVAALDLAGFFVAIADGVVRSATTQRALLAKVMVVVALLSALFLNDAVVLLFTPVVVHAARRMQVKAMPYLAGEAVAANIGSVATPTGNPQNAYIALHGNLTFPSFVAHLAVDAALSLAVAVGFALLFFRKDLRSPIARDGIARAPLPPSSAWALGPVVAGVLLAFLFSPFLPLSLPGLALLGGLVAAGVAVLLAAISSAVEGKSLRGASEREDIVSTVGQLGRRVNWGLLVFFIGLFVLLGGIRESGLLAQFLATVRPVGLGEPLGFSVATAVLSNLVSNVPAVILLAPLATAPNQWFTLAAVSTLAGNATLLGAAANVIVAEEARARGSAFEVGRFVAFGLPLTVVTLALSVALASAAWPVP